MSAELERLNASLNADATARRTESDGQVEEENYKRMVAAFNTLITSGNEWTNEAVNLVGSTAVRFSILPCGSEIFAAITDDLQNVRV